MSKLFKKFRTKRNNKSNKRVSLNSILRNLSNRNTKMQTTPRFLKT